MPLTTSRRVAGALVAVLVAATVFRIHAFANGFVYDDPFVIDGPLIHDASRIPEVFGAPTMLAQGTTERAPLDTYRPVTLLTFFFDAWTSGHAPFGYHATNLLVHLAVVAGLFLLLLSLAPRAPVGLAAACTLVFALSPQLAEAHVWINGRSDPLAAAFGLAALLVWPHRPGVSTSRPVLRAWLAAGCFLLGLLCKEVLLFGLPLFVLLPTAERPPAGRRAVDALPLVLAAGVYLGLRMHALHGLAASHGSDHLRTAVRNLPFLWADGLRELLVPSEVYLRSMRDDYAALSGLAWGAVVAAGLLMTVAVFRVARRWPLVGWGFGWFALTLAPAALISGMLWPGFGRYLYLPCIGIAVALHQLGVVGWEALTQRFADAPEVLARVRRLAVFAVSLWLLGFGVRLAAVTSDFRSNETLYTAAILAAPHRAHGYAWLAASRNARGESESALELYRRAAAIDPAEPRYRLDALGVLLRLGQLREAERAARAVIAGTPPRFAGKARVYRMRALAGPAPEEAVRELCRCLSLVPTDADCLRAPSWMLDPMGPRSSDFARLFREFDGYCESEAARRALAGALRALPAPPARAR
jgi:hypothetical protein